MNNLPPAIDNEFFCIVDRDKPVMAAIISSYISRPNLYAPIFEFNSVATLKGDVEADMIDAHSISRTRANEFDVLVHNCIHKIGGCKNLILAGLSDNQKSFLSFLGNYNVIDINSIDDIDFSLGVFFRDDLHSLVCTVDTAATALVKTNYDSKLKLTMLPTLIEPIIEIGGGIIIIEDQSNVSTIIAINYAKSIGAQILLVDPLQKDEENEIIALIERWQAGDQDSYDTIAEKVYRRVAEVDFQQYEFATFFTNGLPYSLCIENIIPCTSVNTLLRPDFFIFNNLFYENFSRISAAVVFSPQEFADEETQNVIDAFKANSFFVTELLHRNASAHNLDMHIKEFPFEILHICSHGGQVPGFEVSLDFTDSHGANHNVEYDEIIGLAPERGQEMIEIHAKSIFRKFDGLIWKSPELNAKNYPDYVFHDMFKAIQADNRPRGRVKKNISSSCAIKCSFSFYQAMFQTVSPLNAPVIFNNSCWSWNGISESFLYGGVRGYIGTLWDVENKIAVPVANSFYRKIFGKTIMAALHSSLNEAKGSVSENVYMFWGLHFSTIKPGISIDTSRASVLKALLRSFNNWVDYKRNDKILSLQNNIDKRIRWISRKVEDDFLLDYARMRVAFDKKKKSS